MAGSQQGFSADEFRSGIRKAFEMGLPVAVEDRPVFHFRPESSSSTPAAADGVPFNPATAEAKVAAPDVIVDCGVQYIDAADYVTDIGVLTPASVIITLLDEEYARVQGCSSVSIAGTGYDYSHTAMPAGLFDVGVYRMYFQGIDQK